MANFDAHLQQAGRNLAFLSSINQHTSACLDWQVTAAFYTTLHLVNGHLAQHSRQYRKHLDAKDAFNSLSLTKLPKQVYSLQSLSRRSRYTDYIRYAFKSN